MNHPLGGHTDCAEVMLRLYEFLDGEAGPDDCARIQHHLDECAPCLAEYNRDALVKALLRRSCGCESAPASLRASIMTTITTVTFTRYDEV